MHLAFQIYQPVFRNNPQQITYSTTFPQADRRFALRIEFSSGNLLSHAKTRCLGVVLSPVLHGFFPGCDRRGKGNPANFCDDGCESGRNPLSRRGIFTNERASTGRVPTIRASCLGNGHEFMRRPEQELTARETDSALRKKRHSERLRCSPAASLRVFRNGGGSKKALRKRAH